MKPYLHIGKEPNLQKIVIASTVLHLLFISVVAIPFKTKEREYKSYFVNLVGPVETPRDIKGPAIKLKPPLQKNPEPRSKVDKSLKPDDSVAKEIERLRAISSLSKQKKEKEKKSARAGDSDEQIARAIEGIKKKRLISVSKGAGIQGGRTSMDSESYYALITRKIWSEWIYPEFDASGLEVIISIRINRDGKVISQAIEKSSGNRLFDHSAAKAISKASPLPPPPVEMEIGVRFYL